MLMKASSPPCVSRISWPKSVSEATSSPRQGLVNESTQIHALPLAVVLNQCTALMLKSPPAM